MSNQTLLDVVVRHRELQGEAVAVLEFVDPDGAPLPTVPASLLMNLPTLPEPLQYRIVDKHLILLDEDADVIVDYALNIIR